MMLFKSFTSKLLQGVQSHVLKNASAVRFLNDAKVIPSVQVLKQRPSRTILRKKKPQLGADSWSVIGYSTADNYNLLSLNEKLTNQVKKSEPFEKN